MIVMHSVPFRRSGAIVARLTEVVDPFPSFSVFTFAPAPSC